MTSITTGSHFGISQRSYELMMDALQGTAGIHRAVLFGSRATGHYTRSSDIDLAIEAENAAIIRRLATVLNEIIPVPYYFDVVNTQSLEDSEFKDNVLKHGIVIFEKGH